MEFSKPAREASRILFHLLPQDFAALLLLLGRERRIGARWRLLAQGINGSLLLFGSEGWIRTRRHLLAQFFEGSALVQIRWAHIAEGVAFFGGTRVLFQN